MSRANPDASPRPNDERVHAAERLPVALLIALFTVVVIQSAWLSDDGYITMRTVDNLANGRGATWNDGERVQAYTHPLWMLLETAIYKLVPDAYPSRAVYTQYIAALGCAMGAILLYAFGVAHSPRMATFGLCAMIVSKAFVEYSTSGLENPGTHLLLLAFAHVLLHRAATPWTTFWLALLAGLLMLNRLDAALLVVPALALRFWETRSWKTLGVMAIGFIPLLAWEAFSLLYYGSLVPNTAHAKLNNGVSATQAATQGLYYLLHSFRYDPVTPLLLVAGLLAPWAVRQRTATVLSIGALLYLLYVVRIGGDFMGGRMLTPPLLLCIVALTGAATLPLRAVVPATIAVLIAGLASPHCPVYNVDSSKLVKGVMDEHGVADERSFYYTGTALLHTSPGKTMPIHEWIDAAREAVASGRRVAVVENIGFFGFYAGPHVHVVDELALADPLLARQPPIVDERWRIGHLRRAIPAGYVESLESGENRLADAALAAEYERLRLIARGDLLDPRRLRAIFGAR